jgi:hypothetical protein
MCFNAKPYFVEGKRITEKGKIILLLIHMIQTMVLCYWFIRNEAKIRGLLILYKLATNLFVVRHSLLDTSIRLVNTQVSYLITILFISLQENI